MKEISPFLFTVSLIFLNETNYYFHLMLIPVFIAPKLKTLFIIYFFQKSIHIKEIFKKINKQKTRHFEKLDGF